MAMWNLNFLRLHLKDFGNAQSFDLLATFSKYIRITDTSWFPGESINLGGWKNLSGQIKTSGQLMWADKMIYVAKKKVLSE